MATTNNSKKSISYHELVVVLGQLLAVAKSLVFSGGFRFFVVDGIRSKITEAKRIFVEAKGDETEGVKATAILDGAVTWLQSSMAKWMKIQLVEHFEILVSEVKSTFGVEAPEVLEVCLTLKEFKETVSGRIEDFSPVAEKAKNLERVISQVELSYRKRTSLSRAAEFAAKKERERAEKAQDYVAHASMLEALMESFDSESGAEAN